MGKTNSFSKSEHLCGEKRITRLFTEGEAFIAFPMRVVFLIEKGNGLEPANINILVSVPKKRFKRAVKRNRLKRLMRESYRINKQELHDKLKEKDLQIDIAFNYISDDEMDFKLIEKKMKMALQRLIDLI